MRPLYILLIATLLVSCGSSAEQMTATANISQAQSQTAAPTFTSTQTPTPTFTATFTPSATATETALPPNIQGRIQVDFIPASAKAVIPQPPYNELGVIVEQNSAQKEITISANAIDGSFATHLEPGLYKITSLIIKAEELGTESYKIIADAISFEVPSDTCRYIGNIVFRIKRLPPSDFTEQITFVQNMSGGNPVLFTFLETGGLIMPASTRISGAGACLAP